MSNASRIDKQVHGLLPLESYRSPWLPTRRLGPDAVIAIAAPYRQVGDSSVTPSEWFAASPDFASLLAFARTSAVTPLPDFQPGPVTPLTGGPDARMAHATLWRLSATAWPDFFAGRPPAEGVAAETLQAIGATVPTRLQQWLRACCADYLDWLGTMS